jgi:hypothetical protein
MDIVLLVRLACVAVTITCIAFVLGYLQGSAPPRLEVPASLRARPPVPVATEGEDPPDDPP